jgi:uncharacterized protein YjdB
MNPISTTSPVQASVVLTDNGTVITPDKVVWAGSSDAIATVDPNTGIVTPVAAGSCTITATCTGNIQQGSVAQPYSVQGAGTVTVTALGDNLVATVDFQPISV